MSDIRIDLALLASLEGELGTISTTFSQAEEISRTMGSHVGHDGLENVVNDFASKWNVHRHKIEEKLKFVQDSTEAIHDTFVELDRRLANQAVKLQTELTAEGS